MRAIETPAVTPPPRQPSKGFEEAANRVRRAAQSLDMVAALSLNPSNPDDLNAGIGLALRRLEEDIIE